MLFQPQRLEWRTSSGRLFHVLQKWTQSRCFFRFATWSNKRKISFSEKFTVYFVWFNGDFVFSNLQLEITVIQSNFLCLSRDGFVFPSVDCDVAVRHSPTVILIEASHVVVNGQVHMLWNTFVTELSVWVVIFHDVTFGRKPNVVAAEYLLLCFKKSCYGWYM